MSKQAKHFPGPWKYKPLSEDSWFIFNRKDVITACGDENNARLIAAAPEMLDALKDCRDLIENMPVEELLMQVEAAIAKAEGRVQE